MHINPCDKVFVSLVARRKKGFVYRYLKENISCHLLDNTSVLVNAKVASHIM